MKKASARSAESRPETDKAKRVYRAALDTIRRHDDILKQKKAYRDVFLPEAITLRNRLSDYCERLIFYDPLEFGRKAEELLWRKVYYDIIQLMKHNRKQMKPSSSLESAFRTHLMSAMGYYHHLLFRLQHEFGLRLDGVVDFFLVPEPRAHKKPYNPKKSEPDPRVVDWAYRACHRCLLYLGDIARYQQDYDEAGSRILSQRYYYQALALYPDMGMPHNQLGTLAGSSNYNLDAAYHYLRCLTCLTTFEGAQGNLARLLEKNRRRNQELVAATTQDQNTEPQKFGATKRVKDVKRFIVRFLHLLDIFYGGTNKVESRELQECCQASLQDFNLIMFYQPPHVTHPTAEASGHTSLERPQYMEDELVMKVVIMCMMAVLNLERAGNKQMTAAIAFSLALFSHVLNHVVIRLQSALYELENPRRAMNAESPDLVTSEDAQLHMQEDDILGNDADLTMAHSQDKSDAKGEVKTDKKRHKMAEMRRRRRRRREDGEAGAGGSSADDSDLSEGADELDSDSGDETINYLQEGGDASSDSDSEDNLMVSQELRPGFSDSLPGGGMGMAGNTVGGNLEASLDLLQQSCLYTTDISGSFANGFNSNSQDVLNDVTEYLKGLPTDFMTSTNNFFNQMSMDSLFPGMTGTQGLRDEEASNNADLKAVVQGKKEVRVPPGFETNPETRHVLEITEKLADFVIETDTDLSSMPTDTENSSLPTESELEGETTETDRESTGSVIDKHELEEQRLEHLVQVISAEGLLRAIKTYCDWMSCHPHIIATCAQSSKSLWSRLAVLLNFLPLEVDIAKKELCGDAVLEHVQRAATREWSPSEPLCEDLHLHKFPPLHDAHLSLNFDRTTRLHPTAKQEAILRTCCLRRFGYQVARMKSIQFAYDTEKAMFLGPLQLEALHEERRASEKLSMAPHPMDQPATKLNKNTPLAEAEARRNRLMRDMAQLRLQAEVSQLEGSLQSADQPSLPPYLVPDSTALCDSLLMVKQLAASARFIIIIPLAVIDHLDMLKKESAGARQAIRWLEAEFRKGNRYVRAQKTHEKVSTVPHKNLKKRDKDAWRVLQMIDCCKYLSQQSSEWDSHGLVCVLSNLVVASPILSLRVRQAFATAMQEGLMIKSVPEFFASWKDLPKISKG